MLRGNSLKNIKLAHGSDTNVATIGARASILGIFSFRAVLNLAMLVTENERAKTIRSRMLNIVIDVIAKKSGGSTKFINQRNSDYLPSAYMEESYRKQFTDAMRDVMARLTPYIPVLYGGDIRLYFCKSFRLINPIAAKF